MMSHRRHRTLSWIACALLVSAAAPAGAQKPGRADGDAAALSAQGLYSAAQKLFDKGNYAEALVAFRQAYNASTSPNARLMIGQCLIGLGKTADAYEEMAATMREAAERAEKEPKYAPTRDAAAAQIALLESKVGKVVVEVPESATVEVVINGSRIARDRVGMPFAVEPGKVVVSATHSDGRTVQKEQEVKAGATDKISLTFPDAPEKGEGAIPPVATVPPAATVPPVEGPPSGGGIRTAGIVVAGAGVAGLAVFGITGALAQGRFSTLEEECGGERCTDPKYADVIDSGKTLATVSTASLVAGIAGLVGGGLMIVFGGPSTPPRASLSGSWRAGGAIVPTLPPRPSLTVSPAGAGVRCTVIF